jgi:hypothetical protein
MGLDMFISLMKLVNLGLRFFLEICVLIALGYWGFKIGSTTAVKYILGLGAPLIIMTVWGTFGSPGASIPLEGWPFLILEIIIFVLGVAALYAANLQKLSALFGVIIVINLTLMYVWEQ